MKEELEQLKRGIVNIPQLKDAGEVDVVLRKQKLEDGQVKLQSRLEEEEDAKAALLGRIKRLTKLILVSTKTLQSSRFSNRLGFRRRHTFREDGKRDSRLGSLTSANEKSSGPKSTPSTPQAESVSLQTVSRPSHSLLEDDSPSNPSLGKRQEHGRISSNTKREPALSREGGRSLSYEAPLAEKDQKKTEL